MFTAVLFTIAKTWKQPRCTSTEEWIKKMWYINTMEYFSAVEHDIMPFAATWMDLDTIIPSEVSQIVRDKHHILHICGIFKKKKKDTNELICRTETDSQTLKNLWLSKETGVKQGTDGLGFATGTDGLGYAP